MNPQITQTDTDFDSLEYDEICKQEYAGNNCKISAGFVSGDAKPEVDTIYLKLEKDGEEPTRLLLRPDEAQAIVWVLSGTTWSHLYNLMEDDGA